MEIKITLIDTACIIIDINGFRIMTDPVLDKAGKTYHFGYGSLSKKLKDPAIGINKIKPVDLVLLSHHQHQDNFDKEGQRFTKTVEKVITTKNAAKKLSNAVGLNPWESHEILSDRVPGLKITATPARHHPSWLPGFFAGAVTGFIIEYDAQKDGVIYISGDTVLYDKLDIIPKKFEVDLAILHLGSVRFPYLTGMGKYTMNASDGAILATKLDARCVIPIHTSGWSHFKEREEVAKDALSTSNIADKVLWLTAGKELVL